MFAFLDRDHDGLLKYPDFVSCVQNVQSGVFTGKPTVAPTPQSTNSTAAAPLDIHDRVHQSELFAKAVSGQSFCSSELTKYMTRFRNCNYRVTKHKSLHNTIDHGALNGHKTAVSDKFTIGKQSCYTAPQFSLKARKDASEETRAQTAASSDVHRRTFGLTSLRLHHLADPFVPVNGGRIGSVLSNEYQEDRLIDMRMQDALRQENKQRQTALNFRKDTTTQMLRQLETKKKLERIDVHERSQQATTPQLKHMPGSVTQFYPSKDIKAMVEKF